MNLKECKTGFSTGPIPGRFGYIVELDDNGFIEDESNLFEVIKFFPYVILTGKNIMAQKDNIGILIKKLVKFNNNIKIILTINEMIQPVNINTCIKNIVFNVNIKLKKSNIDYKLRINSNILNWYNNNEGNFIFDIDNEDELDEVCLIIMNEKLNKHNVYLSGDDKILTYFGARKYNFNLIIRGE